MTIRSLARAVRRIGTTAGFTRCPCGAILTPEQVQPKPLVWTQETKPPAELEALLPLATAAEKRELQGLLNRCLALLPDANVHEYPFAFAETPDPGPCCPACGAAVDTGPGVTFVIISIPAPAGLLDLLNSDPRLACRYAELETALRRRAAVEKLPVGSTPLLNEEGGRVC